MCFSANRSIPSLVAGLVSAAVAIVGTLPWIFLSATIPTISVPVSISAPSVASSSIASSIASVRLSRAAFPDRFHVATAHALAGEGWTVVVTASAAIGVE